MCCSLSCEVGEVRQISKSCKYLLLWSSHILSLSLSLSLSKYQVLQNTERFRHTSQKQSANLQTLCMCKQLVRTESNLQDLSCFQHEKKHGRKVMHSEKRCHEPFMNFMTLPAGGYVRKPFVVYSSNGTNHSIFRNSSNSQDTWNVAGSKPTWVRLVGSLSTITRSPTLSLNAGTCQRFSMAKESRGIRVVEGSTMLNV